MEQIKTLERKRATEDDSDEEDKDRFVGEDEPASKPDYLDKQPRTKRTSARRKQAEDENLSSVNVLTAVNSCTQMQSACTQMQAELIAVMRNSGNISCHKCRGNHLVRNCPDLLLDNGNYAAFCNYCNKTGHSVGQPNAPTCPVLLSTICPTCRNKGHTVDYCPLHTCAACNSKGHTSKVCRQRKPGVYAFGSSF